MANPLKAAPSSGHSSIDLRAWCEEQNRKPLFRRMCRWYFVTEADGIERIDSLTGCDGENVHRLLDGTLPDFAGWPKSRMDGYRNWLRKCAEAGLVTRPQRAAA